MIFSGHFDKDAIFIAEDKQSFIAWVKKYANKRINLHAKRWTRKRTKEENSYYWAVIIKYICDYTGMFPDEAHDAMKWKFLRTEKKGIEICRSTAANDFTTLDAETFYENIRIYFASEHGVKIPLPKEEII